MFYSNVYLSDIFADADPRSLPASPSSDNGGSLVDLEPVEYTEPPAWCSVYYYELNTRVTLHITESNYDKVQCCLRYL